jgi:hypothetical protein
MPLDITPQMKTSSNKHKRERPRFPLLIWMVIAITVSLSASALYWDRGRIEHTSSSDTRWMTPKETVAEYRREAKGLRLAPKYDWPTKVSLANVGPDGAPMRYEAGFGAGRADFFWFNTWVITAISPHVADAKRRFALRQLPLFFSTALFTKKMIVDQTYYRKMVSTASKGDLSILRAYARSNVQQQQK